MSTQILKTEMNDVRSRLDSASGDSTQETSAVTTQVDSTAILDGEAQQATNGDGKPKTPRKRGPKKNAGEQDGAATKDGVKTPNTTPRKRAAKGIKHEEATRIENVPSLTPQKRGSGEAVDEQDESTPTKKRSSGKNPYPTCKAELSEADKMMLQMKANGKGWTEISAAYSKITGEALGKSTLSNRYPKIVAVLFEWNDGDVERMLHTKDVIDQETIDEIAEFKRRAENDVWKKIAGRITAFGGGSYSADAIEKGYMKEKKEGFPHRATVAKVINSGPINKHQPDGSNEDGTNSSAEVDVAELDESEEEVDTDSKNEA